MLTVAIANPQARGSRPHALRDVAARLRAAGGDVQLRLTTAPRDATRLTREAIESGARRIVAVGGDGTVHECVNGFFRDGSPLAPDVELGVVPLGTGCDFARSLAGPGDLAGAVERILDGPARRIDVGRIRQQSPAGPVTRVFVNACGFGLGAEVVEWIDRRPRAKRLLGAAVFGVAAGSALARHRGHAIALAIDDAPLETLQVTTVAACNGRFFGGDMQVAPDASLDDGALDLVIVLQAALRQRLRALWSVYRGAHLSHPMVRVRRARRVHVEAADGGTVPVEADGESCGVLPALCDVLPGALLLRG